MKFDYSIWVKKNIPLHNNLDVVQLMSYKVIILFVEVTRLTLSIVTTFLDQTFDYFSVCLFQFKFESKIKPKNKFLYLFNIYTVCLKGKHLGTFITFLEKSCISIFLCLMTIYLF